MSRNLGNTIFSPAQYSSSSATVYKHLFVGLLHDQALGSSLGWSVCVGRSDIRVPSGLWEFTHIDIDSLEEGAGEGERVLERVSPYRVQAYRDLR